MDNKAVKIYSDYPISCIKYKPGDLKNENNRKYELLFEDHTNIFKA